MAAQSKQAAPPEAAATAEEMADAIRKIADGTDQMLRAGLNRRAICVLLKDATGISLNDISKVLNGLADLGKMYTTPRGRA